MGAQRSLPLVAEARLSDSLDALTTPAELVEPGLGDAIRCVACAHRCRLRPGQRGSCGVRINVDGVMRAPWGYVSRRYVRAVETNTVYHVHPGALALTFGTYGCDLRCPYCHNFYLSQALREPVDEAPIPMSAAAIVQEALDAGCEVVCAAYNEPLIAAEWVREVFSHARRAGLTTALITDGHSTAQALAYIAPVTDVVRIDLKALDDRSYRKLGGRLDPVLDTLARAHAMGLWVEVVTLVVPGLNDDPDGLRELAGALARLDPELPWHLNAAQPRYRHRAEPPPSDLLASVAGAAYLRGLRYVYVGNVRSPATLAHTRCPSCHSVVVRREDFRTLDTRVEDGRCPSCKTVLAGLWDRKHAEERRARRAVAHPVGLSEPA